MQDRSTIVKINDFNDKVIRKGGKTILFAPTPKFQLSIEQCISNWYRPIIPNDCSRSFQSVESETRKFFSLSSRFLDESVLIYDPSSAICDDGSCSMTDYKGKPLYVDNHHLTDHANSEYIFPDFLSFLMRNNLLK